jgi:hypothetical protein
MNARRFILARLRDLQGRLAMRRVLRHASDYPADIARAEWEQSLHAPTAFYLRAFCYFHRHLPEAVRQHRRYFASKRRGFGEDAFHTMWFLLFREFKPATFLEIGVYRGQVISLAALLARHLNFTCEVHGLSPFTSAGDEVSRYRAGLDYLADTLRNFDQFHLPHPRLLKAFSTDPVARDYIRSKTWDAIYIDGSHDYPVVKQDWDLCAQSLRPGGIIVLDDAALFTTYQPPVFASKGHPGPSRLAEEIDPQAFREILQVGHNRVFQKL